ncbi:cation:proton antiporter [Arsenicitalea aurantiaca]|uniref:Cation:proton antiporter n=1 Tax=Arsenicitalea aurantiaca TaxID=1783274 RepID=A0A433XAH4_9HYPH|nr:cation:proton antiporter [Arsenicitalea aurantiaca]RUT31030.1 cation:proton antiporter [Arsenicitalea aurantiaca]
MSGGEILAYSTTFALVVLGIALLLVLVRLILGPTLADRILALDTLTTVALGFIGAIALRTGYFLYLDIAVSLALVGFLATVAFARYLLKKAEAEAVSTGTGAGVGQ